MTVEASSQVDTDSRTVTPVQVILIVPDDPIIGELIEFVIDDEDGWVAELADSTDHAIEIMRQGRADALIVDVPFDGGLDEDLLVELQSARVGRAAPVVLLSSIFRREIQSAVDRGLAAACIEAPLDIDDLVSTVRRTLDRERFQSVLV